MNSQNVTAVLDVQSDKLSIVIARASSSGVRVLYRDEMDYAGFQDGEFLDKDAVYAIVPNAISKAAQAVSVKIKHVLVGVPGEFTPVVCRTVRKEFPKRKKLTAGDLDKLHKEGADFTDNTDYVCINSSPIYYITDSHSRVVSPIGSVTSQISCYISYVLMEKGFKDLFDSVIEKAGASASYCSSMLAEIMFIIPTDVRDNGAILLDTGYISSSVAYAKGDGILHNIAFSLGSGHIAAKLYQELGIPYSHACALLRKINMNLQFEKDSKYTVAVNGTEYGYDVTDVNEVCFEVIQSIGNAVNKAVSMAKTEIPQHVPMLITGSGIAEIIGARELLEAITKRPIGVVASAVTELSGMKYSSLASLVLYSLSIKNTGLLGKLLAFFDYIGG